MRMRRLLIVLLVTVGLITAACSDSKKNSAVSAGKTSTTAAAGAAKPISFVPLDPGAVTFDALGKGDVQVALLFSTEGVIAERGWVVLADDMTLQGSDNLIPLIRKDKADATVSKTLNAVSAKLTTAGLTELNRRVDSAHEDTAVVAKDFLTKAGLLDGAAKTGGAKITVGSANFSESEIVAQMYKLALEHEGYTVSLKAQLGSREVLVPAIKSGQIDVEPEYEQSLLVFLDPKATSVTPTAGVTALGKVLDPSMVVLDPSPAQDQNALVVTKATATKYHLTKVSDLKSVMDPLKMAGPPECPQRPLCIPGYQSVYGLQFSV